MYSLLVNETAESLRSFHASVLPEITPDWWSANVISALLYCIDETNKDGEWPSR